jgi:hypothetical protein
MLERSQKNECFRHNYSLPPTVQAMTELHIFLMAKSWQETKLLVANAYRENIMSYGQNIFSQQS